MLDEERGNLLLELATVESRSISLDLEEVKRPVKAVLAHEVDFLFTSTIKSETLNGRSVKLPVLRP